MTRFTNILAAMTLATAFLPIAANATTMTPPRHAQTVAHQASQVIVHSGATNQRYPDSLGG